MTATASSHASTIAKSYLPRILITAVGVLVVLAYMWLTPSASDEARLDGLRLDPTLELPTLDGETPELVETDSNVASRSWTGSWSITEHIDRYDLLSRRVDRYAPDLYDHVVASSWSITAVRCDEDEFVLTARQPFDGDWATFEVTAWADGPNGRMTVRSAVSAEAGTSLVADASPVDPFIECAAIS